MINKNNVYFNNIYQCIAYMSTYYQGVTNYCSNTLKYYHDSMFQSTGPRCVSRTTLNDFAFLRGLIILKAPGHADKEIFVPVKTQKSENLYVIQGYKPGSEISIKSFNISLQNLPIAQLDSDVVILTYDKKQILIERSSLFDVKKSIDPTYTPNDGVFKISFNHGHAEVYLQTNTTVYKLDVGQTKNITKMPQDRMLEVSVEISKSSIENALQNAQTKRWHDAYKTTKNCIQFANELFRTLNITDHFGHFIPREKLGYTKLHTLFLEAELYSSTAASVMHAVGNELYFVLKTLADDS